MASATNGEADRHPESEGTPKVSVPWHLPIESYHNGKRVILTLKDTYHLFWRVPYAWLLALDFYRWCVKGHSFQGYVCQSVRHQTSRLMLYLLHARGHRWLTLDDLELIDPRPDPPSKELFASRISRMNHAMYGELPPSLWPFIYVPKVVDRGLPQPGYRLRPDCEILMVVGVAQKASCKAAPVQTTDRAPLRGLSREPSRNPRIAEDPLRRFLDDPIDWTIFQTPPDPETGERAQV